MKKLTLIVAASALLVTGASGQLLIDFSNAGNQDGGNHDEAGWQTYKANHEVAADFVTQNFSAFGTTISLTPTWPDTDDNRVMQMIDRGAGNDANYSGILPDLMTDWIGADARTGNGGNGDGNVTSMTLSIVGLPAGDYSWLSYHHDTENMHSTFEVSLGGSPLGNVTITHSSVNEGTGAIAANVTSDPATFAFDFTSNGTDPIEVGFALTPPDGGSVHKQFIAVNGFQITQIPEPSTGLLLVLSGVGFLARRRR